MNISEVEIWIICETSVCLVQQNNGGIVNGRAITGKKKRYN